MATKAKVRDIVVIRQYYINGINLLIKIDFAKKKASFVEPTMSGNDDYKPKKWLFADREPGYLKTWAKIFDAQKQAINLVIEELEELKDSEFKSMVKMLAEMGRN